MLSVFLLAGVTNGDAIVNMLTLWFTTDTYMHGIFVIPLAMIMASQKNTPKISPKALNTSLSILAIVVWAVIMMIGHLTLINTIQQGAVILTIPLMVLLIFGPRYAWHYRAPLCLLFFAVPFGDFLVPWLQSITADMSVYLLELTNVPVLRNGWYISIPAANFRVAEACSGINFLISTFTVSVFYAFTYMEKSSKRITFMLLGVLVPLVANGLRVYLIIMIAHSGNVEAATGFDHLVYGWIFFVFILIMLFTIGYFWQDPPEPNCESGLVFSSFKFTQTDAYQITKLVIALLVINGSLFAINKGEESTALKNVSPGATIVEGDSLLGLDYPLADFVSVTNKGSGVQLYEAYYRTESVEKKMIGFQNRWFDGKRWSIHKTSKVNIGDVQLNKWELVGLSGVKSTLYFTYCVGGELYSSRIPVKIAQAKSRVLGTDFGGSALAWLSSDESVDLDFELNSVCSTKEF